MSFYNKLHKFESHFIFLVVMLGLQHDDTEDTESGIGLSEIE